MTAKNRLVTANNKARSDATRTMAMLRREIQKSYQKRQNWRRVAEEFGITSGMAHRIGVDGYEPKEAHIRVALGLPSLAPAPVCARCGVVHVTRRCTRRGGGHGAAPLYMDLFSAPPDVLRWQLENREPYDGE